MGEEDALQPPPIQTFEPLDLTVVDARNKTLFEECSAKVGAGDGGEDIDDNKRKEILKSVRSILVQELLDCGSGDEFGTEGAPRFRGGAGEGTVDEGERASEDAHLLHDRANRRP